MVSGAPKTLGPNILGASSPNINLSTKMASEAMASKVISEHLIFLGGSMPPDPPIACVLTYAPSSVPPPPPLNRKYLLPPLLITLSSVYRQPWLHPTVVLKQKAITGNVSNYSISTSCLLMLWCLVAPVNCVAGLI